MYFSMIAYRAFQTIKILKKTYQYSVGTTIFTMFFTAVLMSHNSQASQRMDTYLFASLYTLLNFYIYLISYFYAPVLGGVNRPYNSRSRGIDESDAERERN